MSSVFLISASPAAVFAAGTCTCLDGGKTLSTPSADSKDACQTECGKLMASYPNVTASWVAPAAATPTSPAAAEKLALYEQAWKDSGQSSGDNVLLWALSLLIYAVLNLVSYIVSLGATLLEFVLNPVAFSGLFNLSAVYNMWRMVRDFLNLFFILTILFIAFATIFQVQAYNYKKLLWNLVLMALLTNFSFPVARFLIDVTNVPMYFFLNSLSPNSSTGSAGTALNTTIFKASGITEKILPGSDGKSGTFVVHGVAEQIRDMLLAIVFVFIFGVSLIVLAILLFIRALVLLVLVIFSPIGFVGTAIPWLNSYAKQWWDNFMKYAFFGPVSALMLLVSANVMTEFNSATIQNQLNSITTKTGSGNVLGVSLASSITTMVPVILIWMSISVGQSMGIAGASKVAGTAQKFAKAVGRKATKIGTLGLSESIPKNYQAYKKERDSRKNANFAANNVGGRLGRATNRGLDRATSTVGVGQAKRTAMTDLETAQQNRVKEETTRNRINDRTSEAELLRQQAEARKKNDKSHLAAVTHELASRESTAHHVTEDDMKMIGGQFKALGGVDNAVDKDTKSKVAKHNARVAYNDDVDAMQKAFKTGKIKMEDQAGNTISTKLLTAALEANKLDQKVLEELHKDSGKSSALAGNLDNAVTGFESRYAAKYAAGGMTAAELKSMDGQRANAHQAYFSQEGKFHPGAAPHVQKAVYKKADATTMRNVSASDMATHAPHIAKHVPAGKQATMIAGLAEQDTNKARALIAAMKTEEQNGSLDAHDVMKRLRRDNRTNGLI